MWSARRCHIGFYHRYSETKLQSLTWNQVEIILKNAYESWLVFTMYTLISNIREWCLTHASPHLEVFMAWLFYPCVDKSNMWI